MARRVYSDEVKAQVMAALLTGEAPSRIAEQYDVPENTVKAWKYRQTAGVAPQIRYEIGDLLLAYVKETLFTLREQARHFRDKSWLITQNAHDLAFLHGIEADKTIRILEALARGNPGPGAEIDASGVHTASVEDSRTRY